jgi:hypothetical protein
MSKLGFDVNEYESVTGGEFEIFEPGEYQLKALEAEETDTSKGDGTYIAASFEVLGPTNAGRRVWCNFNINNPSEKGQKFGRRMLAGWARACGKPNAKDTDELLDRKFMAVIGIEKGSGQYKDKNIITGFLESTPVETAAAAKAPPVVKDPFEGHPPHVKVAVTAAGGLGTPSGDATFAALTGAPPVAEEAAKPAAVPAAKPAPAKAAPAAPAAKGAKAPWD